MKRSGFRAPGWHHARGMPDQPVLQAPPCVCQRLARATDGHDKGIHFGHGHSGACMELGCGCLRYTPDDEASRGLLGYEPVEERIHLALFSDDDEEPVKARRLKAASACASTTSKYDWLNIDVCVHRKGGRLELAPLNAAERVRDFVHDTYATELNGTQEVIGVIALDSKLRPLGAAIIHRGGENYSMVDGKLVLRPVMLMPSVVGFILWHNHPSEDPQPSQEDFNLTFQLKKAAETVGLRFFDHVVIGGGPASKSYALKFYSFAEHGNLR